MAAYSKTKVDRAGQRLAEALRLSRVAANLRYYAEEESKRSSLSA